MASSVRIQLELDRDSEPIAGRAVDASGRTCRFSNWLTLIAILEDLRRCGDGFEPGRPSASGGLPDGP